MPYGERFVLAIIEVSIFLDTCVETRIGRVIYLLQLMERD